MTTGQPIPANGFRYFQQKFGWIGLSMLLAVHVLALLPGNSPAQNHSAAAVFIDSIRRQEELHPHVVWYFPGANLGSRGDTNLFTRTYCRQMRVIMQNKFIPVNCAVEPVAFNNILWAVWHAQYPMKNPWHDHRIRNSINKLATDSLSRKSHITVVSSSYGTVVAAQMALYLVKNRERFGLGPEPINLVLGASMMSQKSRLYRELERLKNEGRIGCIVYDELQFPGDNVTGMCGNTRLYALTEVCRMAFPVSGTYKGQPSILNDDPVTGHIHRKREVTADKVIDYITKPLVDYELAGPWYKYRALMLID